MASKDEKPQKKQSLFKQIAQIYKFTVADDKKLPAPGWPRWCCS